MFVTAAKDATVKSDRDLLLHPRKEFKEKLNPVAPNMQAVRRLSRELVCIKYGPHPEIYRDMSDDIGYRKNLPPLKN